MHLECKEHLRVMICLVNWLYIVVKVTIPVSILKDKIEGHIGDSWCCHGVLISSHALQAKVTQAAIYLVRIMPV